MEEITIIACDGTFAIGYIGDTPVFRDIFDEWVEATDGYSFQAENNQNYRLVNGRWVEVD